MKIKFLLIGTSLSFLPTLSFAQCVATQDCATLGYTETSCNGGKGVKCPFGNKWACLSTEESVCKKNGFRYDCSNYAGGDGDTCGGKYKRCSCNSGYKWSGSTCIKESCSSAYQYTCKGAGYDAGSGTPCGGKYITCKCSSGYTWKNGLCQKDKGEAIGDLYYCNGRVVAVKTSDMDFYIAMNDLGDMNWGNAYCSTQNYTFCGELKGTLPTEEQLHIIYRRKSKLDPLLSENDGSELGGDWYWSSTVVDNGDTPIALDMSNGRTSNWEDLYDSNNVWPVLVDY